MRLTYLKTVGCFAKNDTLRDRCPAQEYSVRAIIFAEFRTSPRPLHQWLDKNRWTLAVAVLIAPCLGCGLVDIRVPRPNKYWRHRYREARARPVDDPASRHCDFAGRQGGRAWLCREVRVRKSRPAFSMRSNDPRDSAMAGR